MKRIVGILVMCFLAITSNAQDGDDAGQTTTAREKIKAARIGFITQRLGLTSEQAEKFWPIYNEFVQKRLELRSQYKQAERAIDPAKPDPKQQQALVDLGVKIKQDEASLEKTYSDKLKNVISAQQILNLRQAEKDFRATIINMLNNRRQQQERKENFRERNQRLRERKNN